MVEHTSTDDPNAAVLLNEDGLCTYGKLPDDAIGEITTDEIEEINQETLKLEGSMQDLREVVSEVLTDQGYGPVQWPIPDKDIQRIRSGQVPEGLLLTHLTDSIRSAGVQNGSSAS